MSATLAKAIEWHKEGVAVWPLPSKSKGDGRARWKAWQDEPQSERDVRALFKDAQHENIAALYGRASGALFGLDCDGPQSFDEEGRRLSGLGIETRVVRSNTTTGEHRGGGTYMLRAPVPVCSNGLVRGQGEYSVVYGVHPTDSVYTVTPAPIVQIARLEDLPWLELRPAPEVSKYKPVPRLARSILKNDPKVVARYKTRSEAEAGAVCSLIHAGFAFNEILALFLTHGGPGTFADKHAADHSDAARYLQLTYHTGLAFVAADTDGETRQKAQRLKSWALSRPWPGQTGATDCSVYLAHLSIVLRCGKEPYHASARDLAELAGVRWRTANRATRRLRECGLVELDRRGTGTFANTYTLRELDPPDASSVGSMHIDGYTHPPHVEECVIYVHHDVFSHGALGKAGADVWRYLRQNGTATVAEIAAGTGRHRNTTSAKLRTMFSVGMVEPVGDGRWRAIDDVDLDGVAVHLGRDSYGRRVAGMGERQRREHKAQRRRFRSYVELTMQRKAGSE